jgi:signal transduction histidine kinase/serine/threonine protein kinase
MPNSQKPSMPSIPLFRITDVLGSSIHSVTYKGTQKSRGDRDVAIKVFRSMELKEKQLRRMQQQIERLRILNDPLIITPLAIEQNSGYIYMHQSYFNGITARDWLRQKGKLDLSSFFEVALQLSMVVNKVHESGIIHGGIKPNNVLIDPGNRTIRLIDFISPFDVRDISHFIYDKHFIEETLPYTSPEQTGRINHRVSFSTDMYSLGILFFELLVGRPPFKAEDPLELIHYHLANDLPNMSSIDSAIPEVLSQIVAKLCVKEPEKRYQSCYGLYHDLNRCFQSFSQSGECPSFPLGVYDYKHRVIFISKMVGRRDEADLILSEYQNVVQGEFRSLFISGYSGIGKTRLIQELQRPLVENRGYFTSGKFDQYQKNIPYSSLIQALRNLMRTFLTESNARLGMWREKILAALEGQGRIITDVIPELEIIIGNQPAVPALPPVESRNRFNNLFGQFLTCLASKENPLILFIDDLQWCDVATFDFFTDIFANAADHPYLFFLGAYRHNEVDEAHPLTKLLKAVRQKKQPIKEVRIGPLNLSDCQEMVSYILDTPVEKTKSLTEFIFQLTEGNPLFVSESLSYLYNENLLYFSDEGEWHWNIAKIRETNMPSSVVALFSAKILKLPQETLDILVYCACMGNNFDPDFLAIALNMKTTDLFLHLRPVLALSLLIENKSDLQFIHDRVQEAVLKLLDDKRKKQIHWEIGQHLLAAIPVTANLMEMDQLFTLTAHLNLGRPDDIDSEWAYRLSDINYQAGKKALDALATDAANKYFAVALGLLPADCWTVHYQSTFKIYQMLAKTELMNGRYESSEKLLNQLLNHAQSDLDKAEALSEQTTSLSSIGSFIQAIATANRGLAYFDKTIPDDGAIAHKRMLDLMSEIHAAGDVWGKILNMPFTEERNRKIELAFYSELIPDLYMTGLVPQLYLSAALSTQNCLAGGMDESVIYSFSIMGLNLGEQEKFAEAFAYQDLAHQLCERYPNTFGATRGMNGIVWCNMHSRSHPAAIVEYALKGIHCGRNCGDLYNAGLSYGPLMWNLQVQGAELRKVEDYANECLVFSRKNHLAFSEGLAEAVLAGWVAPMNKGYEPVPMKEKIAAWEKENYVAASGSYYVHLSIVQYYFDQYVESQESLEMVKKYLLGLTDNVLKRQWYVFQILNALRLYMSAKERGQQEDFNIFFKNKIEPLLKKVETWAKLGPLLQPYLPLIYAEMARAEGKVEKAKTLYLDAIQACEKNEYTFLQARALESIGEMVKSESSYLAQMFLQQAFELFKKCGAERKQEHLLEKHPNELSRLLENVVVGVGDGDDGAAFPSLDINYLVKSSLILTAETQFETLLFKIMSVVLENSGAQSGFLLLKEGEELFVYAESRVGMKDQTNTLVQNMNERSDLCKSLIQYTFRTGEEIIFNSATKRQGKLASVLLNNDELADLKIQSVMVLPILKQQQLIGVIYLENRLVDSVFSASQIEMTKLLISQAAIALDNARLIEQIKRLNADLENRVNERTNELRTSNKELEAFSYSVAHDLRSPLRSIDGFSTILLESIPDLNEENRGYLLRMRNSVIRMGKLIDDLLTLSRTVRSEMHRQKVNLSHIAGAIADDLSHRDKTRHVEFIIEDNLWANCDFGLVRVVLENLIANAWKFSGKKGDAKISFNAKETDGEKVFSVSDNGVGFDMAFVNKLFLPFQRLHSSDEFDGTGIGLAIVHRVIERHGGKVWVESKLNEGTTFYFTLSAAIKAEGNISALRSEAEADHESKGRVVH